MDTLKKVSNLRKAFHLMVKAHNGVYRKFSGVEYAYHPVAVAQIIISRKISKHKIKLVIAALLHDTVEDNPELVTIELIRELFGEMVANLVFELTSDPEMIKIMGKKEYLLMKMLKMTSYGLVIKLADRLHNCRDLVNASDKFRNNYVPQTRYIINGLADRYLSKTHKGMIREIEELISVHE